MVSITLRSTVLLRLMKKHQKFRNYEKEFIDVLNFISLKNSQNLDYVTEYLKK